MADTAQLKLTVNVEQKDIRHIQIGQSAAVSVYALPDQVFTGVVDLIIPVSDTSTGLVTYPVTLHFTDKSLAGLLPGMTATAIFTETAAAQ
jgi:multidrug resistance efflux pump